MNLSADPAPAKAGRAARASHTNYTGVLAQVVSADGADLVFKSGSRMPTSHSVVMEIWVAPGRAIHCVIEVHAQLDAPEPRSYSSFPYWYSGRIAFLPAPDATAYREALNALRSLPATPLVN